MRLSSCRALEGQKTRRKGMVGCAWKSCELRGGLSSRLRTCGSNHSLKEAVLKINQKKNHLVGTD